MGVEWQSWGEQLTAQEHLKDLPNAAPRVPARIIAVRFEDSTSALWLFLSLFRFCLTG
jgi:hypothetical protein